uniref:Uncharacterized protein n=1 Tax=Cuerna arida TaxID=1464854 RepID=A0A1B6F073_9HEMI
MQSVLRPSQTRKLNSSFIILQIFLFTSRFSPEKNEDIEQYLTKKEGNYVVEKLNSKRPDLYSSFQVGIPSQHLNEIYSPLFWPYNLYVSKFINKKPSPNIVTLPTSNHGQHLNLESA